MLIDRDDINLIALGKGRLDWSPKKNWVEEEGGLPTAIDDLAAELVKKGMTRERAIATAISRAKRWAATSKDAKVRAKWGKAVAQWESMKAKAKARPNKSEARMSSTNDGGEDILMMSSHSYNMSKVNAAFHEEQRVFMRDFSSRNPEIKEEFIPRLMINEVWNDSVIASDQAGRLYRVAFVVTSGGSVVFGSPVEVKMHYVPVDEELEMDETEAEDESEDAPEIEMSRMSSLDKVLSLSTEAGCLDKILRL